MNILIVLIFPIILGLYAQFRVNSAFDKNSKKLAKSGIRGAQAAELVMKTAGINNVEIVEIGGKLTDHYDPKHKRLALSKEVYHGTSLAALGVAAHEAGHAIQDKQAYAPLQLRMALIPITNIACNLLPIVMFGGFFFFHSMMTINLGIVIYLILTVFQLVTLPVEFDASNRAKACLAGLGAIEQGEEMKGVRETLNAAAFTYVAAFVTSLIWLLHLISIRNR